MTDNAYIADFPALAHCNNLTYLDSAASTQLPRTVIDAMSHYLNHGHANINRSSHQLARQAHQQYQSAKQLVAQFIGAEPQELIFCSGATAGLNMLASGLVEKVCAGDEIIVSELEHHANLVPWQQLAKHTGAKLLAIPATQTGDLALDKLEGMLSNKTKIIAICHVANSVGTVVPIPFISQLAKKVGALLVVDGAQAIAHLDINVKRLGCDYYVFSGHKMYGPTGIGVIYGTTEALEVVQPSIFGGEMVSSVNLENSHWNTLPYRLEAGTANIVGAIGLGAAASYLQQFPYSQRSQHERDLYRYALQQLKRLSPLRLVASPSFATAVIAFTLDGIHPQDAATVLDQQGIALRCGKHCAMPLADKLFPDGSLRISLALYNQRQDIDTLINAIKKTIEILSDED